MTSEAGEDVALAQALHEQRAFAAYTAPGYVTNERAIAPYLERRARAAALLAHIAELEGGIRRIHEACKRGENTQDHGPRGNVACILDHLLDTPSVL